MTTTPISGRKGRHIAVVTTTGVVIATALSLGVGAASAAPLSPAAPRPAASAYSGDAYGSTVDLGSVVRSGRSAPVTFGCTVTPGLSRTNSTVGLDVPLLAHSGTITTTATTTAAPAVSRTTARTEGLILLGGMVKADAVESASATSRSGSGFSTSAAGTTLLNLKIMGQGQAGTPAPNTRVALPGIGYVVLNEQVPTSSARSASLEVNALHVVVDQKNLLGFTVGSNIVVSHARSGLSVPVVGVLGGNAYGSRLTVGPLVTSGPSFQRSMPCLGTDGVLRTSVGAGLDLSPALKTGAVRNTVRGTVTDTTANAETTSTVDATNLLDGLVTATAVKASVRAAQSADGTRTFTDASTFGTLKVQGFPNIDAAVPANTELALPGVGTLYLHRVVRTNGRLEVRMVELVLADSSGTLPAGADLRAAVAAVSLR